MISFAVRPSRAHTAPRLPSPPGFTRNELFHKTNLRLSPSSYFLCYCFFFPPPSSFCLLTNPLNGVVSCADRITSLPYFLMAELNLQPAAAAAAAADESVSATSSGSKRLADSLRTSRLAPPLLLHPHPLSRLLAGSLIKSPYMIPLAKGQNPSQYHYFVIKQMPPASVTILCSDLPPPESTGSAVFAPPFSYFLWHSTKRTLRCFVSIQLFYSQAREAVKVNIIFSKRN